MNFKFSLKNLRISLTESYKKLEGNLGVLFGTCLTAMIIMAFTAFAVFGLNVKGPEKVLVPNLIGKSLEDAILEMQVKQLNARISLRYSDTPGDEGTVLAQNPAAESIVKGYSNVDLVVSRGVIVNQLDDYVGMNYEELKLKIQALFAGQSKALIVIDTPKYIPDSSAAGTILEQDPPAGTSISEPVNVSLVVSRGPNYENTKVPDLKGQSVNDLLQTITRSKLVFDITSHRAKSDETPGTVTDQMATDAEYLPNYSRLTVEMAMPDGQYNGNVYGIFKAELNEYPYPVPMRIDAAPTDGDSFTLVSFYHPGGNVTLPYAVPKGTVLTLYVADKVAARKTAN